GRRHQGRPIASKLALNVPIVLARLAQCSTWALRGGRYGQGSQRPLERDPHMADDQRYDVIIIGTGAGGGTLAHRLAPTGKRILILERGEYLPRERDNWDSTAVFVKSKYRAPEIWYDKHGNQFPPEVNYYVGG